MTDPLDIFAAPLDVINLVEASAGTGKTYALAGLYLRLLVEQGYRTGGILVVTYTRAATEELKDRIRSRLLETRQAFQQERDQDAFCRAMLERYQDRRQAIRRLNNALLAFDEAAIFTIHGFCQRVLSDSAFASGMPLASEILADDAEVLQEIVEDFWRRQFCDLPPRWANHVIAEALSPKQLQQTIRSHLNKPYLKIAELAAIEDLTQAESAFEATFQEAARIWRQQREEIEDLLVNSTILNRNTYNAGMPDWFIAMDDFLNPADMPMPRRPDKFVNFTLSTIIKKTKKGHSAPHHLFFEACEALNATAQQLQAGLEHYLLRLRHDLLCYCNEELPRRKRRRQVQSYDDLLLNLHAALTDPRRGASLAESVRSRFPAALIDEFQDTDPTQYAIFQSIYQDSSQPVFLVGDPKQAIYSFRGADIFAYLGARQDAGQEHTLAENWRSDPALVQAVNHLFSHRQRSFLLNQIGFTPVRAAAGEGARLVASDGTDAPLRFWFVPQETDGKAGNKEDVNPKIARAVAGRIAALLTMARQGTATMVEQNQQARPLNGGDIAVLVRSHRQADLLRRALLAVGVVSVQHSRASVFATAEAVELERLLQAVADPSREDRLRAALLTELCGISADTLYGLMQDEAAWENILYEFADYHRVWREEGFIQMFRAFLLRRDGYRRLLSYRDGERRLTNVLHLAELLQTASLRDHLGLAGLVKWLAEQRQADEVENEAIQLRLESDAQLVKIVTIHKSKGLEYPIVFCPFLWDGKLYAEKASMIAFHDPDDHFQPVLDPGSPQLDANRPHALREELAENLRLTYVALTRARHRCYVVWGGVKDAEKSALAWLLYDPPVIDPNKTDIEAQRNYVGKLNNAALLKPLDELATQSGGAIHVSLLPEETVAPYHPGAGPQPVLAARTFAGQIRTGRRFTSFSALQERRSAELPDYDPAPAPGPPAGEGRSIFTFPRGTRAGTCLHAIFENIDFTGPGESITSTAAGILRQYGFEEDWIDIVALMVDQVRYTPLDKDGDLKLSLVTREQRLTELDFMYPFDHLDVKRLRSLLGGVDEVWAERLQTLDFRLLEGFMRGFIDLVFEHQGRYYLVDYKSNWLGPELEDYRPPQVAAVMAAGGYHLQYLIYTVAVHRYLRRRLPGYDYDRHFGGVRYLFLRGMRPDQGLNSGVFAERPARELIEALDRYIAGQSLSSEHG